MGLAQRLEAESAATLPGPDCSVAVFLASLADGDRAEVLDAMSRTATIKTSVLQRAFKEEFGVYVSSSSLQRHRKGDCRCARTS